MDEIFLNPITTIVISLIALIISAGNAIYQNIVRGPNIKVLNADDTQDVIALTFKDLPQNIQNKFTTSNKSVGHALIKIIFGNYGDRAGVIKIRKVEIIEHGKEITPISKWTQRYVFVPAYDVVEHEIMLANVPLFSEIKLEVNVILEKEIKLIFRWKKRFTETLNVHFYKEDHFQLWYMA